MYYAQSVRGRSHRRKGHLAKELVTGGVVALAIGLVGAAPASAAPEAEYRFLQSIASLGSSYSGWPQFLSGIDPVPVGYQVCSTLNRGGNPVAPVLRAAGESKYSDYYATIFAGYAVQHLCPEHTGAVGSV